MARQDAPTALWFVGGALFLAAVALAAMSPLGPFAFGGRLMWSELATRRFRRVLAPADLAAPGAPLGNALARLDAAVARAHGEGRQLRLGYRSEGYFFDAPAESAGELNRRLALVFVARAQLAYEHRLAAEAWAEAISGRDMIRLGALVFVCVVLLLCVYEPVGAAALFFGPEPLTPLRLAASALGAGVALAALSRVARSGSRLLLDGFSDLARARLYPVRSHP
jgi:hypothetical protein